MKLPRGIHVKPEKIENFFQVCRDLEKDFSGAMRLKGVWDEETYLSDLLIDGGLVIAASFKRVSDGCSTSGTQGLTDLRDNLSGSSGKLDLFSYTVDEMTRGIEANSESLLDEDVKLADVGVKIKSKVVKGEKIEKKKPGLSGKIKGFFSKMGAKRKKEIQAEMKMGRGHGTVYEGDKRGLKANIKNASPGRTSGKTPLVSLPSEQKLERFKAIKEARAGNKADAGKPDTETTHVPSTPTDAKEGPGLKPALEVSRKEERLGELKEKRLKKIAQKMLSLKEKREDGRKITEGMKVETTIDKMYNMVTKKKVVRINDALAKHLGVSKTQVEEWSMILEEHNLVELHYPAIGDPELRIIKDKE